MEQLDKLSSFHEVSHLEMSLKELDDDSFSSDEESSEHFNTKLMTLKWLSLREKQLKIAINYEKLKKETEFIEDKDLLCEKIDELKNKLKDLNKQYINESLMANKIQLDETSHSITNRKALPADGWSYSAKQRETIKVLLNEEKKLTKQKSTTEREKASIEDKIFKLNQGLFDSRNTKKRKVRDGGNEKNAELQKLRSENKKVFDRTQLLAKITQSLVAHHLSMSPSSTTNGLLPPLQDVCVRILDSRLDDPQNLRDLLSSIKSVEI